MQHGADVLQLPLPVSCEETYHIVSQLLIKNDLEEAGIRLTITRGVGERGLSPPKNTLPTVLLRCFPIPALPPKPISVMISSVMINEYSVLRACKTINYTDNIVARQLALTNGYDDALLLNTKGQIVSATSANLFLIINDALYTPAISCGTLPGIARQHLLSKAKQDSIPAHEVILMPDDLTQASGAFLTNSLQPLQPIRQLGSADLNLIILKDFLQKIAQAGQI